MIFLTACAGVNLDQAVSIVTPPSTTQINTTENFALTTPEEVVHAFLSVYPGSPPDAIKYLSPRMVVSLNEQTALTLLPQQQIPIDFFIKQGAANLDLQTSVVVVELVYDAAKYWVEFDLIVIEGNWLIDNISKP